MNVTSQILIGVALLSCAALYGSEIFGMLVIRPALEEDDEALTALKRRTHVYCAPRLRLLWAFGSVAAILATAATILAGRSAAAVAMIVAVVVFAIWTAVDLWGRLRPYGVGSRPRLRPAIRADPQAGRSHDSDQPADGGALCAALFPPGLDSPLFSVTMYQYSLSLHSKGGGVPWASR